MGSRRRARFAPVFGLALAAAGSLGIPPLPAGATVSTVPMAQISGNSPNVPAGTVFTGPARPSAKVQLDITFRSPHPRELARLAAAVSTPGSPLYHHFMNVATFAAAFGAPAQSIAAVNAYLRSKGFAVGAVGANHLYETVTATTDQVAAALATPVQNVRLSGGGTSIGSSATPQLPATIAPAVEGIFGLTPWVRPQSFIRPSTLATGGFQPRAAVTPAPGAVPDPAACPMDASTSVAGDTLGPNAISNWYHLGGMYGSGNYGQGATVALVEYSTYNASDIKAFQSCLGSSATVTNITVGGTLPTAAASAEDTADIEQVASLAPRANILVYEGLASSAYLAVPQQIVSDNKAQVASTSWGICEASSNPSLVQAENSIYQEAALQGQTFYVASGDSGSEDCYNPNSTSPATLAVSDPANNASVTAVGGSQMTALSTGGSAETVWNTRVMPQSGGSVLGATGGGESALVPRPTWQRGSGTGNFQTAPYCSQAGGCRAVPDVSALASPGYVIYCTGGQCSGTGGWTSGWSAAGGTSVASPLWAAATALLDTACPTRVGQAAPALFAAYSSGKSPLRILANAGNNDWTGTAQGMFPTASAYSPTTGLGVLTSGSALVQTLCPSAPTPPSFTPASVPFGTLSSSQLPGPSKVITLTNPSGSPMTVSGVTLVGQQASSFHLDSTTCSTVPAGGTCSITVSVKTGAPLGRSLADIAVSQTGRATPYLVPAWVTVGSPPAAGYWTLSANGSVGAYGSAPKFASVPPSPAPISISSTPSGYYVATSAGNVYNFGAKWMGSPKAAGLQLASPIVGIAASPLGGYYVVTSAGNVYNFGAKWMGSPAASGVVRPGVAITSIAATAKGYYVLSDAGNVYNYGTPWDGSAASLNLLGRGISAVAITASSQGGYYVATSAGNVYNFGAKWMGSPLGTHPSSPIMDIAATPSGYGYRVVGYDGSLYVYGDATSLGSPVGSGLLGLTTSG